jgi:hypothetical protein
MTGLKLRNLIILPRNCQEFFEGGVKIDYPDPALKIDH